VNRPVHTWIAFGLCLAAVLIAMGWVSMKVLALDDEATLARQENLLEENVRLALWRMDSAVSYLVGQENIRPYFLYSSFYPTNRPYGGMFENRVGDEVLVPSPLLRSAIPYVLLHFQFDPEGGLTSPQVPDRTEGKVRGKGTSGRPVDAERLDELTAVLNRDKLLAALSAVEMRPAESVAFLAPQPMQQLIVQGQEPQGQALQQFRNGAEWQRRSALSQWNNDVNNPSNFYYPAARSIIEAAMKPLWIGGALVLARRVTVGSEEYLQGCWLDWPSIKEWLLDDVKDLLSGATLERADSTLLDRTSSSGNGGDSGTLTEAENHGRLLASLPVRLLPGQATTLSAAQASPIRLSLTIAWICVLLAAVAVVLLLVGAVSLSERRGAFVSAVTHELRTPLTTLQMYTEMLADGMVDDEAKQKRYLDTLRAESDRLGHLVENVLSYARLEKGKPACRMEEIAMSDLVARIRDRLAQRAGQAGMEIEWESLTGAENVIVRADPGAVEQVLFNLVDNACKYAASGPGRLIRLQTGTADGRAVIKVQDQGAGIAAHEEKHLFKPFRKSAHDAAHSAPGVGLGLALSRRLARMMGGGLDLDGSRMEGACFVFTLPMA